MSVQHTCPLADLRHAHEPHFGGKSAGLGELIAAGIPVPPGFAVGSTAYRAFFAEAALEHRVAMELSGLDSEDLEALGAASTAIVEELRVAPVPERVRAQIGRGYAELAAASGEAEPPVAVRSSALGEDSWEATFAGQQETHLWVRGAERVCDAVRHCWASLYGPEAISYRAQRTAAGEAPAMGVAVQLMVDAAISGVMFTCNPVNGDPSTVAVNASWGLGVAVAGGEVTPDDYLMSKVTREVLARTIGPKQVEYLPGTAGDGIVRADVPPERQEAACLEEEHLGLLVDVARRVERHFGRHQDIEWAIAREGSLPSSLFVLQSRPVTTVPKKADPPRRRSALSLVMDTFGATGGAPDRP